MSKFKYIFLAGAPGSKWSRVAKHLWLSDDIDKTDRRDEYNNDRVSHTGAYFGPDMEYGKWFDVPFDQFSKEQLEAEFDKPFSGTGVRIIKSHHFAYNLEYIKRTWPDCPIIMVQREDDSCFAWWVLAGGFDITYPNYEWYSNYEIMYKQICKQNFEIKKFRKNNPYMLTHSNYQLCDLIGIKKPGLIDSYDYTNVMIAVR